jgi:hypothetical protein
MFEPLAAEIARRMTVERATSALPGAPLRAEPAAVTPQLRRVSARLLISLASRLDPAVPTPRPAR